MVEKNKRGVCGGHHCNDFIELALTDEAGGIRFLTTLDKGGCDGGTRGSGEFFELCTAGIEVEGRVSTAWEVFFNRPDGCRRAGESSGCSELLAFAELTGELNHDNNGDFLLRLRGTEFAGEESLILSFTCFDKTATDCLSATTA